jgi:hypothetical protein
MPYADARCVSAARTSGGNTAASGLRAGLQTLSPREGVKEDFMYLFTFPNASNTAILTTIFYPAVLKAIYECLILVPSNPVITTSLYAVPRL